MFRIVGPIKFGQVAGPEGPSHEYPVAASQAFKRLGGMFVKLDTNQRLDLADSGDTEILGWAKTAEITSSATAGNTEMVVNTSGEARYLIPTDAVQTEAQLKALVGKTCDLIVNAGIQQADIGESTEDVITIYDYAIWGTAADQQAVVVGLTPSKRGATGVV